MNINYAGKPELYKAYNDFYQDKSYTNLLINTGQKFDEACEAFNSFFKIVKAAGGIVRNREKEYLIIKRLGFWDLPKGKLHKNETIQDGALREVTEETGLSYITNTKQLHTTYHIYTSRKGNEILKETYWFEMLCTTNQIPVPQLEEDITEVKWFAHDELNVALQNTYASIRQLLENYLYD